MSNLPLPRLHELTGPASYGVRTGSARKVSLAVCNASSASTRAFSSSARSRSATLAAARACSARARACFTSFFASLTTVAASATTTTQVPIAAKDAMRRPCFGAADVPSNLWRSCDNSCSRAPTSPETAVSFCLASATSPSSVAMRSDAAASSSRYASIHRFIPPAQAPPAP
jgi:hypothetical protein